MSLKRRMIQPRNVTLQLSPELQTILHASAALSGKTILEEAQAALDAFAQLSTETPAGMMISQAVSAEETRQRKAALKIANDQTKPSRTRIEHYIIAKATIPPGLAEEAERLLEDTDDEGGGVYERLPNSSLVFVPPRDARYALPREYWFPEDLSTNVALQERIITLCIEAGVPELEARRRIAAMVLSPPTQIENGYEYYARMHNCTLSDAVERMAKTA